MEIRQNVSLRQLNTFGIDAKAAYFTELTSINQLPSLLDQVRHKKCPLLILGAGSNFLFTKDFPGLVIKVNLMGIHLVQDDQDQVTLKIGAGENWHRLVLYCIKQGYGGIENLSLIPGTVGAAPIQNIGAYGVELRSVFKELTALEIASGKKVVFTKKDCEFSYRHSIFKGKAKGKYLIVDVTLELLKHPNFNITYGAIQETIEANGIKDLSLKAVSDAVIQIRRSKLPDPEKIGNAGSFFKNPTIEKPYYEELKTLFPEIPGYVLDHDQVKIPAAWMIDYCGWKGKTISGVGVHEHQALVLVNHGSGKGSEIKKLSMEIQASIRETFGIELEPEVNII